MHLRHHVGRAFRPADGKAALKVRPTFFATTFFATFGLIVLGFAVVRADGGLLRARQATGPFIVSIFTAPEPLRAGPVEISVFVQSSDGAVVTDAAIDILLESATPPIEQRRARAAHGAASNKLAQAAVLDLPAAGQWNLTVSVRSNGNAADVTSVLPVAAAASRLRVVWPWLLAPPVFIALFAVHQTLKRQRRAPNVGRRCRAAL